MLSGTQGGLSARQAKDIEEIFSASPVAIADCLRLSEFIFWQIERSLQAGCQAAHQELSTAGQQEAIARMRTDLFHFCIRTFILQLVDSLMHRNAKIKLTCRSCTALLSFIHQLHSTLKYRLEQEPITELELICQDCFDHLEPSWVEFQRDPSKHSLDVRPSSCANPGPAEDIMANMKEGEEDPVVGSKVDAANRNYRMAYGMAVGIEASVRVADGMKLYNCCVYGMAAFKEEMEKQLQLRELPFTCEAFAFAPDWPGSEMSHDIINFALSTITLRYSLPETGCLFSPSHILGESEDVWFEDLAPALFSRIRNICKVDSRQYLDSVARREFSFIEFTTNSKSGEVFFFSHDGKFLLKTISNKEAGCLLKMLPEYLSHLQHQTSFLMRICGLHRVCTGQSRKVRHFLVAISVFDCKQLGLHHQFDLKGSTAGRLSGPTEQVKKDVNWMSGRSTIWLPIDLKRLLASIVEEDGKFLAKQNVLDYSILIGIHDRRSPNKGVQCRSVKLLANILREKVLPLISKVRKLQRQNAEGTPRRADSSHSGQDRLGNEGETSSNAALVRENSDLSDTPGSGEGNCIGNGNAHMVVMPAEVSLEIEGLNNSQSNGNVGGVRRKNSMKSNSITSELQLLEELKGLSEITAQGVNSSIQAISPESSPTTQPALGLQRSLQSHNDDSQSEFNDNEEDSRRRLVRELEELKTVAASKIRSSITGEDSPMASPDIRPRRAAESPASPGSGRLGRFPRRRVSITTDNEGSIGGLPRAKRKSAGNAALTDPAWSMIKNASDTQWKWEPPHGPISAPRSRQGEQGRFIYLIGIIDFLTPWSNKKRLEFSFNVMRGRRTTASCIPPKLYAKRQQNFFTSKVLGLYTCASAVRDSKVRGPVKDALRPELSESFRY